MNIKQTTRAFTCALDCKLYEKCAGVNPKSSICTHYGGERVPIKKNDIEYPEKKVKTKKYFINSRHIVCYEIWDKNGDILARTKSEKTANKLTLKFNGNPIIRMKGFRTDHQHNG